MKMESFARTRRIARRRAADALGPAEMTPDAKTTDWIFNRPRHGWTCFFCGETFRTPGEAELHFGAAPSSDRACQIDIKAVREMEEELARYRADDINVDRAMYKMQADHDVAMRRAEEAGYARGLLDLKRRQE